MVEAMTFLTWFAGSKCNYPFSTSIESDFVLSILAVGALPHPWRAIATRRLCSREKLRMSCPVRCHGKYTRSLSYSAPVFHPDVTLQADFYDMNLFLI